MRLEATMDNVVLRVRKQEQGIIATVKQTDDDFCEVVSIGILAEELIPNLKVGSLVLRPVGLSEWHNEETDEVFLVVKVSDVIALGVEDDPA